MSSEAHQSYGDGSDPIIGKVIDGCRIQRKLGQGGMGVVYLAEHEQLRQQFVIKILNPALVGAEDTVERFFREAQACAQLNHPGIVAIQNVGQEGEYYFIRMEYIEGKTLEETIKEKNQFDWRTATQIIVDTGEALSHAHQKGMIHRDIKPENIMLTPQGAVKVMDFGLAKHVHSQAKVSVTGQIVGTPFFMSPEQAGGKPTDARSDIYSLGVTLYYMLTGVKPFNGKNLQEIFLKHFFYAPESPKIYNPDLPEALCEVVKKCLKKKKKERYQSAKELTKDLRTVLEDPDARIVADAASESQLGEAPEGGGGGGGDFGKTIRAATPAGEDGGKTVVAQADKTMVAGGLSGTVRVEEGGGEGTVRVQGDDGQTVRVGEAGDNDATVAVRGGKGNAGAATIKVNEDEEHPAAGLDLPTQVINQLGLDASGVKLKDGGGGAIAVGIDKTKLAIVAAIVAVPLLLLGANEVRAKSKFASLTERFEEYTQAGVAEIDKLDPAKLEALALEMDDAPSGLTLGEGAYASMAKQLRDLAKTIADQRTAAERAAADKARQAELEAEAFRQAAERRDKLMKVIADLDQLEAQGKFRDYWDMGLAAVREYSDVPESSRIVFPVRVGSDPENAEIYLVGDDKQSENLQAGRTPFVIKVRPNREFTLKIRKSGFKEWVRTEDASAYVADLEASLTRQVMRELDLGSVQVQVGPRARPEALSAVAPVSVDASAQAGGVAYLVTHDGLLRAFNLKRGISEWRLVPGEQQIGMYGDATPSPTIVPGQVVLASSLLGKISAHRPQNDGQRIWTVEVGAEVTSPAAFGNAGNGQVVAAGLANGDVVFIVSGREHWRFRTENVVTTRPFLQGQRAFIGSRDDKLYAVDFGKRVLLGSLDLGADIVDGPRAIGRTLVVVTADGILHVVDTTDPSAMREVAALGDKAEGRPNQGVEVEADRIYQAVGKEVRAYSVAGGAAKTVWAKPFSCPQFVTRPVVAGDVIYLGASNGVVYAIDRATGEQRWRHLLPDTTISLPPFVVEQELFVITNGGKIVVLQTDN